MQAPNDATHPNSHAPLSRSLDGHAPDFPPSTLSEESGCGLPGDTAAHLSVARPGPHTRGSDDIVGKLKTLLGEPVVFIRWPRGVKGTPRKWGHLRIEHMTPAYLSNLPRGNIGVGLGEVSGGLCAIDVDADELVKPFLSVNPQLSETLQTHGSRGRVLWIRFTGGYPNRTVKLKTLSGGEAGEFRSTGSQSIIWGIHPDTKQPYQFVTEKPVMSLAFQEIRWPPEIINPFPTEECTEETEETKDTEDTEKLKSCAVGVGAGLTIYSPINCEEDALRESLPDKKHTSNACLFNLARAILTLVEVKGEKFTQARYDSMFEAWYGRAKQFLRDGQSREDYYMEFLYACEKAKWPLGGVQVGEAWERAKKQPLPSEALKWENPELGLLIAFLKELQVMAGQGNFYIGLRQLAFYLGHKNITTVAKWMVGLKRLGYVTADPRENARRATRYRYIWGAS